MNYHNQDEIYEYAKERIVEGISYDEDYLDKDFSDIHFELFNQDYYIIGRYQATQWLGDQVFNCIDEIRQYETDNFGEVSTDFSEPERVVNMYVYIVGEHILQDVIDEIKSEQDDEEE